MSEQTVHTPPDMIESMVLGAAAALAIFALGVKVGKSINSRRLRGRILRATDELIHAEGEADRLRDELDELRDEIKELRAPASILEGALCVEGGRLLVKLDTPSLLWMRAEINRMYPPAPGGPSSALGDACRRTDPANHQTARDTPARHAEPQCEADAIRSDAEALREALHDAESEVSTLRAARDELRDELADARRGYHSVIEELYRARLENGGLRATLAARPQEGAASEE